ncbi:MAG: hypothetical protein CMF62_06220 [Magnetococcales bacterium]|nr:hypothetical protein [Magnetococcales bacterium]
MSGYLLGLSTVLLWGLYNVLARFAGFEGANPVVFVCFGFIVASLVLLVVSGPGRMSMQAFRSPVTWLYGVLTLFEHIFTVYLFIYVTSAEGSLLQRFGVILVVIFAWLFFNRRPRAMTVAGTTLIAAGCIMLLGQLDPETMKNAMLFLLAAIFFQVTKTMVIEAHPEVNVFHGLKDRIRVTAIISFVSCMLIFIALACVAAYGHFLHVSVAPLPSAADFLRMDTLILGGAFGVLIEPASIFAYFYAVKHLKSERFMALAAFVPLITYGLEVVAHWFTSMPVRTFSTLEWACVAVITLGSAVMQFKYRKRRRAIA